MIDPKNITKYDRTNYHWPTPTSLSGDNGMGIVLGYALGLA